MVAGSWRAADAIAEFTSCAAASMSRSRLNWITMRVRPWPLIDVISSVPAMVENCFSRGAAGNPPVVLVGGKVELGKPHHGKKASAGGAKKKNPRHDQHGHHRP